MGREGVEKAGGWGSRRCIRDAKCAIDERIQGVVISGGKAEHLEKRECGMNIEEKPELASQPSLISDSSR
jgi:hypothetical protein